MGTCQFRPKQNVGWARSKKPSRPTLYIFHATPKQENFLCRKKKHYRPASVFKKKLRNVNWKISVGLLHDRCRLLSFLFSPWMKFARCRLGNVWSASSGDASFLDLDRSSLHADVSHHFFRSISVNNVYESNSLTCLALFGSSLGNWDTSF